MNKKFVGAVSMTSGILLTFLLFAAEAPAAWITFIKTQLHYFSILYFRLFKFAIRQKIDLFFNIFFEIHVAKFGDEHKRVKALKP